MLLDKLLSTNIIISIPHGKSGSVFMQSLFDNHPEVVFFPYVYDNFSFNLPIKEHSKEELINLFIDKNLDLFSSDKLELMGKPIPEQIITQHDPTKAINIEKFKIFYFDLVKNIEINNNKLFLIIVHFALAKTLGYDTNNIKYIYMHIHGYTREKFLKFLFSNFPNLYFLPLIRDERESWLSTKKVWRKKDSTTSDSDNFFTYIYGTSRTYDHLFSIIKDQKVCKDRVKIINLNQLHIQQKEAMKTLADMLNIEYKESLCHSSILGKPWAGNASSGKPCFGFDITKAKFKWSSQLPVNETLIIEILFSFIFKPLRYRKSKYKINIFNLIIFIIFSKSNALKNIKFNHLQEKDYMLLQSLVHKDQIQNKFYRSIPFKTAKIFVYIHMFLNRFLNNLKKDKYFTNARYSISMYIHFYKLNKKYKNFNIEDDLFL